MSKTLQSSKCWSFRVNKDTLMLCTQARENHSDVKHHTHMRNNTDNTRNPRHHNSIKTTSNLNDCLDGVGGKNLPVFHFFSVGTGLGIQVACRLQCVSFYSMPKRKFRWKFWDVRKIEHEKKNECKQECKSAKTRNINIGW